MPDAPLFWLLAAVFVTFHALSTFRRRRFWPFTFWPMFTAPPKLDRSYAFRIRLRLPGGEQWWAPRYYYRGRNYSHICTIMLEQVEAGEAELENVHRTMIRNAVQLVGSDCPGVDRDEILGLQIVRLTSVLRDDKCGFDIETDVVLDVDAPSKTARKPQHAEASA